MGIDANYKKFLQRYARCWTRIEGQKVMGTPSVRDAYVLPEILPPSGVSIPFPKDACVCIYDSTGKMKEFNGFKIKNGSDFVYKHVLEYPLSFLNVPGTEAFFQCFDRGSPINKGAEHQKRYSGLDPVDLNVFDDDKPIMNDDFIVDSEQWTRYTNDFVFKQEILEYVTSKIVNDPDRDSKPAVNNWKPPPGKIYFMFGGTLEKPSKDRKSRREKGRFVPSSDIFFVTNQNGSSPSSSSSSSPDPVVHEYLQKMEYRRMEGVYKAPDGSFPKNELDNLLEGEMCAMYFSKVYTGCGKNVMIVSSDGDMLIQSLMGCKDRIDVERGGFKNKVYLRLLNRGYAEDVDVNALYEDLCNDPVFVRGRISDPAPLFAACSFLSKNDYFQDYCVGIGNCGIDENPFGTTLPYVLWTMLRFMGTPKGRTMIRSTVENHARDSTYDRVPILVDDDAFISFTRAVYVFKYHKKAHAKCAKNGIPVSGKPLCPRSSALLGDSKEAIAETNASREAEPMVRAYLKDLSCTKNRMMVSRRARVYSRCLEWVLNYFYNGYRKDCKITSPVATLRNISYHGWYNDMDLEGNVECKMADRVSLRRHTEKHGWCFSSPWKSTPEGGVSGLQIYLPTPSSSKDGGEEDEDEEVSMKRAEAEDEKDEYEDSEKNQKKRSRVPEKDTRSSRPKKKLKRKSEEAKKGEYVLGKPNKIVKPSRPMVKIERRRLTIKT